MKKSSLTMLLVLPLLLVGCSKKGSGDKKDPFAVPLVDIEHLQINLPTMPNYADYASASVRNDGSYDIIDLYEMSDMHAMIDFNTASDKGYFGFSGLANFIKEKRNANGGTILLSSGDMWQGGAESNLTQGKIVAEAMRYVGFECMALGNHEFDWGKDVIQRNAEYFSADMPLLAGNLQLKSDSSRPSYVGASKIVTRGEYKVGIIGTIGDKVEYSIGKSVFADFKLAKSFDFAEAEALRLKNEEHCNVVVWASHEDPEAISVPANVDVIFGGHEHKAYNGVKSGVPCMSTANYGQDIAHVTVKLDPSTKQVVEATGETVFGKANTSYMTDESNLKNLFDQYRVETDKVKQYKLNSVSGTFVKNAELANLSTKAMFEQYKEDNTIWALQNGSGGVRSDISGSVTYGDIYTAFPFDNEVVKFEIQGKDLENFWYNAKYENPRNLNIYCPATKYSEYDTSKTYTVITTDYVCTNVLHMEEGEFTRFAGTVIRDCVAEYIYNTNGLNADNFKTSLSDYSRPR